MSHSVAIVEDDPRLRTELARTVEASGDLALAGTASDLPSGFALLRTTSPDVLLVDLELPGGSGIDLIRMACAEQPRCEVMVLTLFGDERNVVASLEAGACGYLLKDTSPAEVVGHIRTLCAGGSPISPAVARRLLTRFRPPAASEEARTPDAGLSEREHSVLSLCAKGFTHDEIAGLTGLSAHTVKTYVKRIYRKLQVHNKAEAIFEARKLRWLSD